MGLSRIGMKFIGFVLLLITPLLLQTGWVAAQTLEQAETDKVALDKLCETYTGRAAVRFPPPKGERYIRCADIHDFYRRASRDLYLVSQIMANSCSQIYERGYSEESGFHAFVKFFGGYSFYCDDKLGSTYRCYPNQTPGHPGFFKYADFQFSQYGLDRVKVTMTRRGMLLRVWDQMFKEGGFAMNPQFIALIEELFARPFVQWNVRYGKFKMENDRLVFMCRAKALAKL